MIQVPLDQVSISTCGKRGLSVRCEDGCKQLVVMALIGLDLAESLHVPKPHSLINAGRQQPLTIGRRVKLCDTHSVTFEVAFVAAGIGVNNSDHWVVAAGG